VSVVAAKGFTAAGVHSGIKGDEALDLALVSADARVPTAGVFARNRAAAAPVLLSRDHLRDHQAQAIVLNSGCANAATGKQGEAAAASVVVAVADALGINPGDVLAASTGPIGSQLPLDSVLGAIPNLVADLSSDNGNRAAQAIMTTDTRIKEAIVDGSGFVVGGMAKGAAMIRPDMATMLAVITTDAVVSWQSLDAILRRSTDVTFNSLNIDGCPSTNDSVFLMASGASGIRPDIEDLQQMVRKVSLDLALQMARDGEMSDRVITLNLSGAINDAIAREIGRTMVDSDLVRSSFYGGDPNWGRLLAAAGAGPYPVNPSTMTIAYEGVEVARNSVQVEYDRPALLSKLSTGDFTIDIEIGSGPGTATIYACDLTPGYVTFNAEPS